METTTSSSHGRGAPLVRVFWCVAAVLAGALLLHGPLAQWSGYHTFADRRFLLAVPNAADVLSNLPFAIVGVWGWVALVRGDTQRPARAAWLMFCAALIATAAGSAYYHWSPSDTPLVYDRLGIAWACLALLVAFMAERGDARWSDVRVLVAAVPLGACAVLYWYLSGDLRWYLAVQLLPILVVAAALLMRVPRSDERAAPDSAWWAVLVCYAAAKGAEMLDARVFEAVGVVSGHTLKHLFAALGAALLLRGALRSIQLR